MHVILCSSAQLPAAVLAASDARAQKHVRIISRSAAGMDRLIGDLIDYARVQAGKLSIERQMVDAASLVHDSVEMLRPRAEEKKLRLEVHAAEGLTVSSDRDRVLQVLANLVGNAIKFTPEGGAVSVRVTRVNGDAQFEVSDTGPGIPEAQLTHIWQRFWQGKRRAGAGMGLGLSIARGLVEAHGGRIWAESTVGVGSTFYFTLPLAAVPGSAPRFGGEPKLPDEISPPDLH